MNINKQIRKSFGKCYDCSPDCLYCKNVVSQIKQSILKAIKKTMDGHSFDKEWILKLGELLK